MNSQNSRRLLRTACTLALLASARPTLGQAEADSSDDLAGYVVLDEVVVTANRREQSILEVPYNITATTAAQLSSAGVKDFAGLAQLVPGLVYNGGGIRNGGSQAGFILRGLNADRTSTTDQPSLTVAPVSLYIDDTPIFANVHIADIDRVEVLRGPQGTLYGNGSVGGTIRILYNEPDPTAFAVHVNAETSQTDDADGQNYTLDGVVNVPLASNLALRVTGGKLFEHGFIDAKNLFVLDGNGAPVLATPGDPLFSLPLTTTAKDIDDADLTHVRAALKYESGPFSAKLAHLHQEESADGQPADTRGRGIVPSVFSSAVTPGFLNDGFDAAIPPDYGDNQSGIFVREPYDRTLDLSSLEISRDFGFATLTSATSYYDNESTAVSDISGSYQTNLGVFYFGFPRLSVPSRRGTQEHAFAQELRLVSRSGGSFEWVAGLFYQRLGQRFENIDRLPGWGEFLSAAIGFPVTEERAFDYRRELEFRDQALFGELTYHLTDRWQITGGLRAFEQKLDIDTSAKLPICGVFCSNSGDDPEGTTEGRDRNKHSRVLAKFNTSYQLTDSVIGYFTYAEGMRRGGANAVPTQGQFAQDPEFVSFDPDTVNSYELGLKGSLGDSLQFAAAVFQTDWQDPILNIVTPVGGFFAAVNGDGARSRGVELSIDGRLLSSIAYSAGYAYTDAELTSAFTVGGYLFGAEGERLPGVPRHQFTLSSDYSRPFGTNLMMVAHVDGAFRGNVTTALEGSLGATSVDEYWKWNANVGVELASWRAVLFVDNIGNTRGLTTQIPPEAVGQRAAVNWLSRPRTVGLRITYRL
jgi:outer membrane receptor protein involved in Fe transport